MNGEEQLILVAELSFVLAGFAGIVATNQFGTAGKFSRGDAIGITLIVHSGIVNGLLAILPMAIYAMGLSEQRAFNISSGLHCINISIYGLWLLRNMRGVRVADWKSRVFFWFISSVTASVVVLNAMNALNLVFHGQFGPYLLICLIPLCLAGYMFMRLVSRPLWRNLKNYDRDRLKDEGRER